MRAPAVLLLLLRALQEADLTTAQVTATCEVAGSSTFSTCKGIQGTGKNADICCASDCLCTCGGTSEANKGKECFINAIREGVPPVSWCTGLELPGEACALPAPDPDVGITPCGVVEGVMSDDGRLCCPLGCNTCGGATCSSVPMSWVLPGDKATPLSVKAGVPAGATSGDYCCAGIFDATVAVCGVNGAVAPCRMPQVFEKKTDSCGVDGIVGIVHTNGKWCCPLGCATCAGPGCGDQDISYVFPGTLPWSTTAAPGLATKDFCCASAFTNAGVCGENGVQPPCTIPAAVAVPPPVDSTVADTCGVQGMKGIREGTKANCCPLGCGVCGGPGCGGIDMSFVSPYLNDTPPPGATSSAYCCTKAFTVDTPTCGNGVNPPCLISAEDQSTIKVPTTMAPHTISTSEYACGIPGIPGIPDAAGGRCCPTGCGMCAGPGCGSLDMGVVGPTIIGGYTAGAKSGSFCCGSGVDTRGLTCGTKAGQGYPPCLIATSLAQDTCYVKGVEGVSTDGKFCCPIGCGQCGGPGCGSIPEHQIYPDGRDLPAGATASSYCCDSAFATITAVCGDEGVEPPCLIPPGTIRPSVQPAPTPVSAPTPVRSPVGDDVKVTDPPRATPPTSTQMPACDSIDVMVDAEEFDGVYVKKKVKNETYFVKDDSTAYMTYVPHKVETGTSTNTTTTTAVKAECGHWVLAPLVDKMYTLEEYPQMRVHDCATNPEEIESSTWKVQETAESKAAGAVPVMMECVYTTTTPAPVVVGGSGPRTKAVDQTDAPVVTMESGTTSTSTKKSLSTAETAGIAVACGAVALVGAVGLGRWMKNRG